MPRLAGAERSPLKFLGGDPSLDLINTTDWTERGAEFDRLQDYRDLVRWAVGAGVLHGAQAGTLRRIATAQPGRALAALRLARRTRALMHHVFLGVVTGAGTAEGWRAFQRQLTSAFSRLQLRTAATGGAAAQWEWRGDDRLDSLLWPVVRAAAALLTSEEAVQIRVCAGPSCGWMYVDRSRNHLRRWCDMRTCGTSAKSARRRARRASQG